MSGDSVTVRHTSSAADSTAVNTTLTIGGVSDTYTSTTSDLTPSAFTFTDVTNAAHSTLMTSNSITVSGITAATAISVSGGEYSLDGVNFTGTAATVTNGASVTVRHTSSAADSTVVNTTLTIGGVSDTYTSTTSDLTPAAFTFTDVSNAAHSTVMTSNSITVSGITAATAISVTGGEYSFDGVNFTSTAATVTNGASVTVRHTSSAADSTAVNTTLTIGGVSDTYTSTTSDLTPAAFSFTDVTNVAHSTQMTSNIINVSGISAATTISVSGGDYSLDGVNFTSTAATVINGTSVMVRHTSSPADATAVNTTLTIGGVSDTYTSTTSDLTPAAFTFTDVSNASHGTVMTSNSITVSGITAATAISVTGGAYYSINGGTYTGNAGTVVNGDSVTVQHTSSAADSTAVNTTLTIGGVSDTYTSTTSDLTPAAFSFTDVTNVAHGTQMTSNIINVSSITAATAISVTGGTYSINGGTYTGSTGTVISGDSVTVRHTSSTDDSTTVNTTLTIGGVSDTYTTTTSDLTPAAFTFTDVGNAAHSTVMTSNSITVSGITAATAISVTSGSTYSINGGTYTSSAGTVVNGDSVTVRHTSSAADSTAVNTTLTIGGVSDTYTSTTSDLTTAGFTFTDVTNAAHSTVMTSNSIAVSGITAATAISVTGGTYSINSGSYTSSAGTVVNGDSVTVRHTSSAADSTAVNTTLTIGGISDTYTSTTSDLTPATFMFTDVTNVALSTQMTSNSFNVSSITAATAISVSGGTYSINGAAYTSSAGTVVNGNTVTVRHTSAATASTAVSTTLTIGGVSDTFTSLTADDLTPADFDFTDQTDVATAATITSDSITVSGVSVATTISVLNGEYSLDGIHFTSATGMVTNNDQVTVRHTSAATASTSVSTTLTIGTLSATFASTTADDPTPDSFSFPPAPAVTPLAVVTSETITISGISVPVSISISDGSTYEINNNGPVSQPGTVINGDRITLRHVAARTPGTSTQTTVTIGGITGIFTSTTAGSNSTVQSGGGGAIDFRWSLLFLCLILINRKKSTIL